MMKRVLALAAWSAASLVYAAGFQLSSPQIKPNSTLAPHWEFNGFGCAGDNQSPPLEWRNAPAGTQSFAVTMYDPDAPTGSGWWHWVVVNIPADIHKLVPDAGAKDGSNLPPGASHVRIDFGYAGWGGVCPPAGDKAHRYIFTVHALKVPKLDLPADATAALAGYMIRANTLGTAQLSARYGRPAAK